MKALRQSQIEDALNGNLQYLRDNPDSHSEIKNELRLLLKRAIDEIGRLHDLGLDYHRLAAIAKPVAQELGVKFDVPQLTLEQLMQNKSDELYRIVGELRYDVERSASSGRPVATNYMSQITKICELLNQLALFNCDFWKKTQGTAEKLQITIETLQPEYKNMDDPNLTIDSYMSIHSQLRDIRINHQLYQDRSTQTYSHTMFEKKLTVEEIIGTMRLVVEHAELELLSNSSEPFKEAFEQDVIVRVELNCAFNELIKRDNQGKISDKDIASLNSVVKQIENYCKMMKYTNYFSAFNHAIQNLSIYHNSK